MTRNLLTQTTRIYLFFSLILLVLAAPVFYLLIGELYIHETDESLALRKAEFSAHAENNLDIADIPQWNSYNRDCKLIPFTKQLSDTFFTKFYYDTLDAELEPYRVLHSPIKISGQWFTYTNKANLIEQEDIVLRIAMLFVSIISILLVGLFFITKRLNQKLWEPFNEALFKIERFELGKSDLPLLPETHIEEFQRLNASLDKLISRSVVLYATQREFIENAAHELQTPLAIFQAKIDALAQLPAIPEDLSVGIAALNTQVAQIRRLNKNLLLLSHIDNTTFQGKESYVLNALLSKPLAFFEEQAVAKSVSIRCVANTELVVQTNATLCEILLSNLFLNAIRYTPDNEEICYGVYSDYFELSNPGTEPLPANKLFNRFAKIGPQTKGNGLGLAIVKSIAKANNWEISYRFEGQQHIFRVQV